MSPRCHKFSAMGQTHEICNLLAAQELPPIILSYPCPHPVLPPEAAGCRLKPDLVASFSLGNPMMWGPTGTDVRAALASCFLELGHTAPSLPAFFVTVPQPNCPRHCPCKVKPSSSFPGFSRPVMPASSIIPLCCAALCVASRRESP